MRDAFPERIPVRRASLAWLAAALSAASIVPAAASAAVETWPAAPGDKVFPASTRPAAATAGPLIAAARDEYEGAQVAIRSDAPLRITPTVSDLTGPGTIPASAVELFRVGYVKLQRRLDGRRPPRGRRALPRPAVARPGPIDRARRRDDQRLRPGARPGDAPAGRYDGTSTSVPPAPCPRVEVAPVTASRDGYTMVARLNQIQLAKASGVTEDDPRFVSGVYTGCCRCCAPTG